MPLPLQHVHSLRRDLRIHERRLAFLHDQVDRLGREAVAHELILQLGRDPRVLALVEEIHSQMDDSGGVRDEMLQSLRNEPEAILGRSGVELPAGSTVRIECVGDRVVVGVDFIASSRRLSCEWDSADGFRLIQHDVDDRSR